MTADPMAPNSMPLSKPVCKLCRGSGKDSTGLFNCMCKKQPTTFEWEAGGVRNTASIKVHESVYQLKMQRADALIFFKISSTRARQLGNWFLRIADWLDIKAPSWPEDVDPEA